MKENGVLAIDAAQKLKKGILCGNSITKNGILNATYDLCYKCMEDFEEFMRNDR